MSLLRHRPDRTSSAFFAIALVLVSSQPARADLILNGDFHLGNTGFKSDYSYVPGNIIDLQTYDIVTDPIKASQYATSFGDHTSGTGQMLAANGSSTAGKVVWSQSLSVSQNTSYKFSAWLASWYPLSPAELDFQFNGKSIGTLTAFESAGIWKQFSATWNSGVDSSAFVSIVNLNTDFSGNDFALDDISLVSVPEPSSLAFVILSSCAFICSPQLKRRRLSETGN
jgi:hypothetical protein